LFITLKFMKSMLLSPFILRESDCGYNYTISSMEIARYDTYPSNNGFIYDGAGVFICFKRKIVASDRQTGLYVMMSLLCY
jgi:hypothetical protein